MAVDMSRQGLSLKFLPSVCMEGVLNFDPRRGCLGGEASRLSNVWVKRQRCQSCVEGTSAPHRQWEPQFGGAL